MELKVLKAVGLQPQLIFNEVNNTEYELIKKLRLYTTIIQVAHLPIM